MSKPETISIKKGLCLNSAHMMLSGITGQYNNGFFKALC